MDIQMVEETHCQCRIRNSRQPNVNLYCAVQQTLHCTTTYCEYNLQLWSSHQRHGQFPIPVSFAVPRFHWLHSWLQHASLIYFCSKSRDLHHKTFQIWSRHTCTSFIFSKNRDYNISTYHVASRALNSENPSAWGSYGTWQQRHFC